MFSNDVNYLTAGQYLGFYSTPKKTGERMGGQYSGAGIRRPVFGGGMAYGGSVFGGGGIGGWYSGWYWGVWGGGGGIGGSVFGGGGGVGLLYIYILYI